MNIGLLHNLILTSACSPNYISAKKLLTALGLYLQSPSPDNHSVSSEDVSCPIPFLLPSLLNTLRKHQG